MGTTQQERETMIHYETDHYKVTRPLAGGNWHIIDKDTNREAGIIVSLIGAMSYVDQWEDEKGEE
tara:strand:+ start:1256 stop:1450 length:195 start_codon:yes stop_codon:yes gene_type:complete